ncbi:huntingtin [Chelonus insularis]|uniref:huntingtin n=1 Tax=Chelonus insularis TaxID=460826 RepID=UPI00158B0E82|nr:huntingtin [Chelonus insularis]
MATLNNVIKAIENLNILCQPNNTLDQASRKIEKTNNCLAVASGISCSTVKNTRQFSQILGLSVKVLLSLCDDEEPDIRTLADESLNRIMRSMSDGNILKIQFELYNEIQRNGNARSLRAALYRFGLLSHMIKPVKGKPYISNLIPCIVAISKRSEEAVIDTLSSSLTLILKSLGSFMTDKNVKTLLKSFYPNLSSSQSVFRRNAANMILATCLYCRKPRVFLFYVLRYLIDTMIPVSQQEEEDSHRIVGIFGCFKIMLPHIDKPIENDPETDGYTFDCLIQIYKLCLRYIQRHSDHNIVNATLETLAQLLRSNNEKFIGVLTGNNGISDSSMINSFQATLCLSSSNSAINDDQISEDNNESDCNSAKEEKIMKDTDNSVERDLNIKYNTTSDSESENKNDKMDTTDDKLKKQLNIGSFTDQDVPLKYLCRYLASSFLLAGSPGQLISDELFRVSVKSLTLTCIGTIVRLYPEIFLNTLEKEPKCRSENNYYQMISDVLLFAEHSDPQLRGNVSIIIGYYLNTIYAKYRVSYHTFELQIGDQKRHYDTINLDSLIEIMMKAINDESATTCRQALVALNICISSILESEDSLQGIKLIYQLLPLSSNIYFLVKSDLVQVLSELPYITIKYLTGNSKLQDDVMWVFVKLLNDRDPRVRNATSEAIIKFVETAYFEKPHEDEVIRRATYYTERYLTQIIPINSIDIRSYDVEHKSFVNGLAEPFLSFYTDDQKNLYHREIIEDALSIIIGLLVDKIFANASKYLLSGCFQTLSQLSQVYPTTLYPDAWNCSLTKVLIKRTNTKINSSNRSINSENNIEMPSICDHLSSVAVELLSLIISLITSDTLSLDLATHRHLIILGGNLLSGIALKNLKNIDVSEKNDLKENSIKMWNLFDSMEINNYLELMFKHIMRLLNIYVHVINDIQVPVYGKSSLPSFPVTPSLSPRKKLIQLEQKPKERNEKGASNLLKIGKDPLGAIYNLPHYMKLHDILKAAHTNYNSTIDVNASQMYLGLLNATLEVLSQILEIASTYEARKIAEEILNYLESTLTLSIAMSIKCVQQLLKSLFGMNLSARWDELENVKSLDERLKKNSDDIKRGLYDRCLQKPLRQMTDLIKTMGNNCKDNECNTGRSGGLMLIRPQDSDHKLAMVFKSFSRSNQKAFFASFIRIFEPMVIKSLNLYSTTNSIACQCQVLSLLSQLVQFHVNYCLLDTDKTFINFVLNQFPFIEEFQIPSIEILLPKIFKFLVQLSYEKFHSKIIIEIGEIIKLCDGLMASEQSHSTHSIPAIIPVAEDIFLARSATLKNTFERSELETTREYLMSMLLRLIEYHEIILLLSNCLKECRNDEDGEEKWRKWSRMIIDALLSALSSGKIEIENEKTAVALIKLFSAISPVVLRPVDPFLKLLFTFPPLPEDSTTKFQRWLGMINIIFLVLITYTKEENMLARLSELRIYMTDLMHVLDPPDTLSIIADTADPLNATNIESSLFSPEQIFAIFIFRVISLSSEKICSFLKSVDYCDNLIKSQKDRYVLQELSFFLQLCIQIFESRTHPKITTTVVNFLKKETIISIENLNQSMVNIANRNFPMLTVQWVHLMTLLTTNDQIFWSHFIGEKNLQKSKLNDDNNCLNRKQKINIDSKIVSQCAKILFCDHICDNLNDVESLSWLIMNYLEETMNLENELPVRDFITAVHKNSAASGLFIQGIAAKCQDLSQPAYVKKLLKSLECAHESQSGALILILIPRFISSSHAILTEIANQIIKRRIEILLTMNAEQFSQQISKENLSMLMETLQSIKFIRKHGNLVDLINKVAVKFYDMSPLELDYCRPFNPQTVKNVLLNKQWFISQIKLRCNIQTSSSELSEFTKLLSRLDFQDCYDLLMSKDFNVHILEECIKLSTQITVEEHMNKIIFKAKDFSHQSDSEDSLPYDCLSPLYRSATICLSSHIQNINELVPKPHYVYDPMLNEEEKNSKDVKNSKIIKYTVKFRALMEDTIYWDRLFALIPAVTAYMKSIREFDDKEIIYDSRINYEDLAKFSILCLETAHWILYADELSIKSLIPHNLDLCLTCVAELLKNEEVSKVFGSENHYSWICSASNTLIKLVEYWILPRKIFNSSTDHWNRLENQLKVEDRGLKKALENDSTRIYGRACLQMASLIAWMERAKKNDMKKIPIFIQESMNTLIIIVSRQELVNSFVLTPPLVWKHGWVAEGSGSTLCHFPLLLTANDSNFLQELDVLHQFVYRVTLLGWTSRLQFEEIWMVFLSVLSASSSENKSSEPEDLGSCEATILAVQGITRLLMQTFLLPYPGSPINSCIIHHSRDPPLALKKPASKRLYAVQDLLSWKYATVRKINTSSSSREKFGFNSLDLEQLFTRGNIERDHITHGYDSCAYSQLSVQYLWSSCSLHEDKLSTSVISLKEKRNKALSEASLDLDSCVIFLIELYSRWLSSSSTTFPRLLNEVIKSIIFISELFRERNQFQWMFDTCWEIERFHPIDDEILHHSLIFAICKSAAVLAPLDIESLEKVKRVIETGLKLNYFPCQIATLHGILYLFQSAVQANCEETMNAIQPIAVKYIQSRMDLSIVNESEDYQRIMWALVFFLLEHAEDTVFDSEAPDILDLALSLAALPNISVAVHRTLLQGFERLIATRNVTGRVADQLVKLSLDRLRQPSLLFVLPALRLLLTCMYTESADRFNQTTSSDETSLPDVNPEVLMRTIERTSTIFDRIKRGYPMEVKILCAVISEILVDFFPPFEILTKVIGEFLLPQQPHQKLIASIVFKVCERITDNPEQLALLQDWVIFSLPNFIESLPLVTSTWCLSCFFVSASTNPWLRAFFPYVQSRIGKYEYEDKKILSIAALDFYRKLSSEAQRQAFVESFSLAESKPSSPFSDIMMSLQV